MASISCASDGKTMIQFTGIDGRRRTIRIGRVSRRIAEFLKGKVESLLSAAIIGCSPDPEVVRWIASLGDVMLGKLAAVGLIPKRRVVTLKDFINAYIRSRIDVKPGTREAYLHAYRNLIEYFGETKILREVTAGDVDEFRLLLIGKNLADNTVRRRCGIAKQFFRAAIRKDIIEKNPFEGIKVSIQPNPDRMYFITLQEVEKVLELTKVSSVIKVFSTVDAALKSF